jgi:hypothetical protein
MLMRPLPEDSVLEVPSEMSAAVMDRLLFAAVRETPFSRMNEPWPLPSESAVKLTGASSVRLWLRVMLSSAV